MTSHARAEVVSMAWPRESFHFPAAVLRRLRPKTHTDRFDTPPRSRVQIGFAVCTDTLYNSASRRSRDGRLWSDPHGYGNDANSFDKSHRWAYWTRARYSARPCCRLGRHFIGRFGDTDHDGRCYRTNSSKGLERATREILTSAMRNFAGDSKNAIGSPAHFR